MGRAGRWFAIEDEGVVPDIVLSAKSLGGGLPISADHGARRADGQRPRRGAWEAPTAGTRWPRRPRSPSSTRSRAEGLLERSRAVGESIDGRLHAMQDRFGAVGDVRGRGAMRAMELVADRATKEPLDGDGDERARPSSAWNEV